MAEFALNFQFELILLHFFLAVNKKLHMPLHLTKDLCSAHTTVPCTVCTHCNMLLTAAKLTTEPTD